MDSEFEELVLGALNWIMGELARKEMPGNGGQEFRDYYINAWLPRQRELIDKLRMEK